MTNTNIKTVNDEKISSGCLFSFIATSTSVNEGRWFVEYCPSESQEIRSVVCEHSWDYEAFAWAIAEGRIDAKSIWKLEDKLFEHEIDYIYGL
jgi:hypothetical protein